MTTRLPKSGFAWDPILKETPDDARALKFLSALNHAPASDSPAALRPFIWRKPSGMKSGLHKNVFAAMLLFGFCLRAAADTTNSLSFAGPQALPDMGASLLRIFGALALVIGLFLGGVWLFRNWQRLALQRGRAPKLNVVEARSLGGRHALYVIAYEQERFLLASSPTGVNLLSHLKPSDGVITEEKTAPQSPASFAQTLTQLLKGK